MSDEAAVVASDSGWESVACKAPGCDVDVYVDGVVGTDVYVS